MGSCLGSCCFPEYQAIKTTDRVPLRTFNGRVVLAKVVEVCDGNTITVVTRLDRRERKYRYKVRIAGIDAPELRTRSVLEKAAAVVVRNRLRDLTLGKMVTLSCSKEDKYGRILAHVHVIQSAFDRTGKSVSKTMLREKLVKPSSKMPFTREELACIIPDE